MSFKKFTAIMGLGLARREIHTLRNVIFECVALCQLSKYKTNESPID